MKLKEALNKINKKDSKIVYGKGNRRNCDELYPHVKILEDDPDWEVINQLMADGKL